jgi:hypothetical protein
MAAISVPSKLAKRVFDEFLLNSLEFDELLLNSLAFSSLERTSDIYKDFKVLGSWNSFDKRLMNPSMANPFVETFKWGFGFLFRQVLVSAPDNNYGGYCLKLDPYSGVELVGTCAQWSFGSLDNGLL